MELDYIKKSYNIFRTGANLARPREPRCQVRTQRKAQQAETISYYYLNPVIARRSYAITNMQYPSTLKIIHAKLESRKKQKNLRLHSLPSQIQKMLTCNNTSPRSIMRKYQAKNDAPISCPRESSRPVMHWQRGRIKAPESEVFEMLSTTV